MVDTLKDHLREELLKQVRTGLPVTYKELAGRLALSPPRTIHRLGALEQLMDEDNAVRLQLFALAYNLANFLRSLVLPTEVAQWSLTTVPGQKGRAAGRCR